MGIDYSINLYFYRDKVWEALDAILHLTIQASANSKEVTLVLPEPGHPKQVISLQPGVKAALFPFAEKQRALFFEGMTFWLPVASDEREMFLADGWKILAGGIVPFGSMHLRIDLKKDMHRSFVQFELTAVTDGMSELLEHSYSIKRFFGTLLARYSGICGIIDREDYQEAILWWLKGQEVFDLLTEGIIPNESEAAIDQAVRHDYDLGYARRFDTFVQQWATDV